MENSKFNRTDQAIMALSGIFLVVFAVLLVYDSLIFHDDSFSNQTKIGLVQQFKQDVRKKNMGSFGWTPIGKSSSVFENDSIFTGVDSTADVVLDTDGSRVHIAENSLVTFKKSDGQMTLNLKFGGLRSDLAANAKIRVESGKDTFELKSEGKSSTIDLDKARNGKVDFSRTSSSTKIMQFKKSATKIVAQSIEAPIAPAKEKLATTKLTIGPSQTTQLPSQSQVAPLPVATFNDHPIEDIPIEIDTRSVLFNKTTETELKWNDAGQHNYSIEIAKDAGLSQELFLAESKTKSVKKILPAGEYYWRVKAKDDKQQTVASSKVGHLVVAPADIPILTEPADKSALKLEVKRKATTQVDLNFSWSTKTPALYAQYRIQLAQDASFTKGLKVFDAKALNTTAKKLTGGQYFARVQGIATNGISTDWSRPIEFKLNISEQKAEFIPAPILKSTKVNFNATAKRLPSSLPGPKVEWEKIVQAKKYKIEISRDANFKSATSEISTQPNFVWLKMLPGKSYVRVFALGEEDLSSEPSNVATITVDSENPILSPLPQFNVKGTDGRAPPRQLVKAKWSSNPLAKSYKLQISDDPKFASAQTLIAKDASSEVALEKPGTYYLRVQALGEGEQPISDFSGVESTKYDHYYPLRAPLLLEPYNKSTMFMQTTSDSLIWLEWQKLSEATEYEVEVSADANFSKLIIQERLEKNRLLVKEKLPFGTIYWRVRALNLPRKMNSDWTPVREFKMVQATNDGMTR